jgi:hypothetical protein
LHVSLGGSSSSSNPYTNPLLFAIIDHWRCLAVCIIVLQQQNITIRLPTRILATEVEFQ